MEKNKACAIPKTNFARFDGLSAEARRQEQACGEAALRRQRWRRRLLWGLVVGMMLAAAAGVFLQWPRVDGYVNIAPLTVMAVQGERATFHIDDGQAAELLGQEIITVPYLLEGMAPAELFRRSSRTLLRGETEKSCQLLVHLTNLDLLRLGVNPFVAFGKQEHMGRNDWVVSILRTMFASGGSDDVLLSLRYMISKEPLLWYAE